MSCACKTAKKINQKYGSHQQREKKGFWGTLSFFLKNLGINLLRFLIVSLVGLILVPFIYLMLVYSFTINGELNVKVPEKYKENFKEAYQEVHGEEL